MCIKEDSDCAVQCGAVPVCPVDTIEVTSCTGHDECEEHSLCGTTISCTPGCLGLDAAPIVCPENYVVSNVCDSSNLEKPCLDYSDTCSGPLFCNYDPNTTCLAFPVCDSNTFMVDQCRLNDSKCEDVSACNSTISCAPNLDCDSVPRCADNEVEFASKAECETSGTTCRQAYECSSVIWCGANDVCRPPTCKAPSPTCEDPDKCIELVGCGVSVVCEG